jgi:hypothetical protein
MVTATVANQPPVSSSSSTRLLQAIATAAGRVAVMGMLAFLFLLLAEAAAG